MDSTHKKIIELFDDKFAYEQITLQTITKNEDAFNKSYKKINHSRRQILVFIN